MATTLTGTGGTISYGTFTFDPAITETIAIRLMPEPDVTKRTSKYITEEFTIKTVLYSTVPATVDDSIRAACRTLTSQGDKFVYKNKGYGTDFDINVANRKDVAWGPRVKVLSLKPLADKYAWELIWTVAVCVPECNAAKFENAVMEFGYQVEYSKDKYGYTTRTVSGKLSIPQTRTVQSDRRIKRSADEYREKIRPVTPAGFRPGPDRVILSADKCTLDFSFVDTQLQSRNQLPPGVVDAVVSMTWDNTTAMNMFDWNLRFDGEFTMTGDSHLSDSQYFFWGIVMQRLAKIFDSAKNNGMVILNKDDVKEQEKKAEDNEKGWWERRWDDIKDGGEAIIGAGFGLVGAARQINQMADKKDDKGNPIFIPMHWSASEPNIFGIPKANFSLTYRMVFSKASHMTFALWEPIIGTEYNFWKKSVGALFNPRGDAGLKFNVNDDVIIDLCKDDAVQPNGKLKGIKKPFGRGDTTPPIVGNITAENSWVRYSNFVKVEETSGTVSHKPIPTTSTMRAGLRNEAGISTLKTPAMTDKGLNPFATTKVPDLTTNSQFEEANDTVIQARTEPVYQIILFGNAVRAGWEITPPELVQIGDSVAVPANDPDKGDGIVSGVISNCGVPIYACQWQQRYTLTKKPSKVTSPLHPIFNPGIPLQDHTVIGDLAKAEPEWEKSSSSLKSNG